MSASTLTARCEQEQCCAKGCSGRATIIVRLRDSALPLCWEHQAELQETRSVTVEGLREGEALGVD